MLLTALPFVPRPTITIKNILAALPMSEADLFKKFVDLRQSEKKTVRKNNRLVLLLSRLLRREEIVSKHRPILFGGQKVIKEIYFRAGKVIPIDLWTEKEKEVA